VKQLFILCAILIQTTCCFSAGACPAVSSDIYAQDNNTFSIPEEEPSALKRTVKFSRVESRIRTPRNFATVSCHANQADDFFNQDENLITAYTSPFYLPLVRQLLFPKHYFW
jgi:hypothetical protein